MMTKNMTKIIGVIILIAALSVAGKPLATAVVTHDGPRIITREGVSSYYSYECAAMPMANGRPFDPEKRTCASWFYKFGTVLIVRSLDTGLATEVVVTDRGPNRRLVKEGRIIDLSKKAFSEIAELNKGLIPIEINILPALN